MYRLLLVSSFLVIAFGILLLRYRVEVVYPLLASIPISVFLIGIAHESVSGIQQFNHQLLHVAYDSSYALSLIGLSVILRGVIKRKSIILIAAATCLAGIPLGYLWIAQP
jgi:hypothetical protein